jgi:hypothetical protein
VDARSNRYNRTSLQFRRWLRANPKANLKRQVEAFNSIADAEYKTVDKAKSRRVKKAVKTKI